MLIGYVARDDLAALIAREDFPKVPILITEPNYDSLRETYPNVVRYDEGFYEALPKFKREVLDHQ